MLSLLLAGCATGAGSHEEDPTNYSTVLASIEKRLNHHTDNVSYAGPEIHWSQDPEARYYAGAIGPRGSAEVWDTVWLVLEGRFEDPSYLESAQMVGYKFELKQLFVNPHCQTDWCPTERVSLRYKREDLDSFAVNGLRITFAGEDGDRELEIPASYFRAFRDSFSLPPEWTTMLKGF